MALTRRAVRLAELYTQRSDFRDADSGTVIAPGTKNIRKRCRQVLVGQVAQARHDAVVFHTVNGDRA